MKPDISISLAAVWRIAATSCELLNREGTNRRVIILLALGLVLLGQISMYAGEDNKDNDRKITLDLAVDCRTFKYNRGVPGDQVLQGDSYLTKGRIFSPGTLRPGPQANDPNDPGSVGSWVKLPRALRAHP